MLSNYKLKIADFYNIPISNVKKRVPNFFGKENMCFIMKTLFKASIEIKKIHHVLDFSRS